MKQAYITLATTDEYCIGALNWAMSLKRTGTKREIVVMITDTVTKEMRNVLQNQFNEVVMVDLLDSQDATNLQLLSRPDLGVTFTKLHCWRLTNYDKAVFMDADTLVLDNIDDLFEREELSAAPDPGWPDCFNSGVFVFKPDMETYGKLLNFALEIGSFDGGDQGLLNMFFSDWATKDIKKHLPFVYNCISQSFYSYAPAFSHFKRDIKVVHFIGAVKPWHYSFDGKNLQLGSDSSAVNYEHLMTWWSIFVSDTKPLLTTDMGGLCASMAQLDTSKFDYNVAEGGQGQHHSHQQAWEHGIIDYRGLDKFSNIQEHLDSKISGKK